MKERNGGYTLSSLELDVEGDSIVLEQGVSLRPEDASSAENLKRLVNLTKDRGGKKEKPTSNSGWGERVNYEIGHGFYYLYAFGIGSNGNFSFMVFSDNLETYSCELHISPSKNDIFDYILGGE